MLAFADAHRVRGVLANAVRMARKSDATVADVLDATHRLVPLDARNVDRHNAEGSLKSGKEMLARAEEVALLAGRRDAGRLVGDTRTLALRFALDPHADIGLDELHLPEFDAIGGGADAQAELQARCEAGLASRYGAPGEAASERLAEELAVIAQLGFADFRTVQKSLTLPYPTDVTAEVHAADAAIARFGPDAVSRAVLTRRDAGRRFRAVVPFGT